MGDGTPIAKVRGLGSAHSGSHHWLLQRFTAIGNLLASVWFVASLLLLPNLSFATVSEWIARPVPALALGLLVVTTFWHARLGMQVFLEDYVHEHANKFAALAALNFACFIGAAFGLFCIVRLALGGA